MSAYTPHPESDAVADRLFEAFMERVAAHDECVRLREIHLQEADAHKHRSELHEQDRLFHFEELQKFQSVGNALGYDLFAMLYAQKGEGSLPPTSQTSPETLVVKDFVLAELRRAFPASMRASEIRKRLLSVGQNVHEKTVGMSLYRLSKKHLVRREGADWFFVPDDSRFRTDELVSEAEEPN